MPTDFLITPVSEVIAARIGWLDFAITAGICLLFAAASFLFREK